MGVVEWREGELVRECRINDEIFGIRNVHTHGFESAGQGVSRVIDNLSRGYVAARHMRVNDWIRGVTALLNAASQHLTCVPESARSTIERATALLARRSYIFTPKSRSTAGGGEGTGPLWVGRIIDAALPLF